MQNGGKRARHSIDQWDRQSQYFYSSAEKAEERYNERESRLTYGFSDGSRQETDGISERANG